MKVFLSWSGSRSREVASLLSDWLSCVIQVSRPWISTRDLDRGSLWFGEINDQLKDTTVGVICLTQENKNRPWILFEAGALAKGLSTSRVCTLLVDLAPQDIEDPLAQFNHTFPTKDSMLSLVRTLNNALGNIALDNRVLEQVFATYWPQFEKDFQQVIKDTESATPMKPRPKEDVLVEILENTRMLNSRIRRLELDGERSYSSNGMSNNDLGISVVNQRNFRARIRSAVREGAPIEMIHTMVGDQMPNHLIDTIIQEEVMRERVLRKQDDLPSDA